MNLERLSCLHQALLHTDRTPQRLIQISAAPAPREITPSLGLCQITKWNFLGKTPVCSTIPPRAEQASSAFAKASSSPSPSRSSLENDILRISFETQSKRDRLQKRLNEQRTNRQIWLKAIGKMLVLILVPTLLRAQLRSHPSQQETPANTYKCRTSITENTWRSQSPGSTSTFTRRNQV